MRILKSIQFWVGLVLVGAAFAGVLLLAELSTPPTYNVAVAAQDIPAYTSVQAAYEQGYIGIDTQSFSPALLKTVVTEEVLQLVLQDGVFVETVRAGEVLNRGRIATGENGAKVQRLSLALTNPYLIVKTIPIDAETMPYVALGDVVDLYTTIGTVRATELITAGLQPLPAGLPDPESLPLTPEPPVMTPEPTEDQLLDELEDAIAAQQTVTITMQLPVTKRLVPGALVMRVNREQIPNPQYGAVSADGQQPPPFIEGGIVSVDVVVPEDTAEALDWAIYNGKMSLAVRPALWREAVEAGQTLPPTNGFTWDDFNTTFWQERDPANVEELLGP